jgi:hypothetical protein
MQEQDDFTEAADDAEPSADERGRSTITFPYSALTDAEAVAREVQNYGGAARPEDVANALDQKARSGAFRQKVSSARLFGLVDVARGEVSLNALGRRILDPETRDAARVQAFFNIPLYKDLYDTYSGQALPKQGPLENDLARRGVSPKSAATARQVFMRSAELAGFFRRGPNRLILPAVEPSGLTENKPSAGESNRGGEAVSASLGLPPALEAPILAMLETGEAWSPQQTHEYVNALRKMRQALGGP